MAETSGPLSGLSEMNAAELAFGLLWHMRIDRRDPNLRLASDARVALGNAIGHTRKGRGIQAAREFFAKVGQQSPQFSEWDWDVETTPDPQNTADPGQGCDIPSHLETLNPSKAREIESVQAACDRVKSAMHAGIGTPSTKVPKPVSENPSQSRPLGTEADPSDNGTHERYATVTPSAAAAAFRRVIATEGNMSNDGDAVEIAQEALMLFCEILDLGHVANCEGCGKTLFEGDLGYRDADGDITWCGDCAPTYGEHLADIRASDAETLKAHAGFVAKIRKYLDDGGDPCAHYTFPL